ncbi:hypothetical protein [Streptomyces sp. NPDC049813]|uniref:hypothetical protein n=1 Tax=Streptomyces sp. NPDC049813 TaxID=3365597 RepID=UPI0037A70377
MTASDTTPAPGRPTSAWPLENALLSAVLAAQRVSWIDAPARALGLKPFTRRHLTRRVLAQLRRTSSGRPTRLRTAFGTFLMPLTTADATGLIGRADEAGARGAVTALTAAGRRLRLTPHAAPAAPRETPETRGTPQMPVVEVRAAVDEAAARLLAARRTDGSLTRADWCALTARLARRIVLGAEAADDSLVSAILEAAGEAQDATGHTARVAALRRRLAPYVHGDRPDGAPWAALADDDRDEVVEHALETVTRALADTAVQALALMTVDPLTPAGDRAGRAVFEALRRYPPLAATVHQVRAPFTWQGLSVEAGTEILCATAWLRDLDDAEADDGAGGEGHGHGSGAPSASLCAAPGPCAAAELAVLAAVELVGALTRHAEPVVLSPGLPGLTPDALPDELPAASLRLALSATGAEPDVAVAGPGRAADGHLPPGAGQSPAHYAGLVTAGARTLDEHARRLADCARQPGWNHDAFGEQCRMTLLAHAERCARAAADARRTAEWLAN